MRHTSRLDLLLLLMVVIWGANFTVLKIALAAIPPLAFNGLRLLIASAVFMALVPFVASGFSRKIFRRASAQSTEFDGGRVERLKAEATTERSHRPARRDVVRLAALGFIGHFIYQLCFIEGVARTSVANSALIIGTGPVSVALLTAVAGHERVTARHWAGAALSVFGIYLLVGRDAELSRETLTGDLLILLANLCWAFYTVGARPLLKRLSALVVTGYSMMIGTVFYLLAAFPELARQDWSAVRLSTWLALFFSGLLALNVAYLIWYTAVQRLGNIRTSMYSNVVPIVAMLVALLWLGERIGAHKVLGAAAILSGLAITRAGRPVEQSTAPIEG
ncbi:MAG: EamA family transporter [Acidobacteria bacterium]|nr:EamA family transporter [Acidobacteriota bacterium]